MYYVNMLLLYESTYHNSFVAFETLWLTRPLYGISSNLNNLNSWMLINDVVLAPGNLSCLQAPIHSWLQILYQNASFMNGFLTITLSKRRVQTNYIAVKILSLLRQKIVYPVNQYRGGWCPSNNDGNEVVTVECYSLRGVMQENPQIWHYQVQTLVVPL